MRKETTNSTNTTGAMHGRPQLPPRRLLGPTDIRRGGAGQRNALSSSSVAVGPLDFMAG